jgi:hypothetical protein
MKTHSHKGRMSKSSTMKDVPLLDMTKAERDQTFADLAGWPEHLCQVRRGQADKMQLAILYLCRPDQADLQIIADIEWGDGAGIGFIIGMEREIKLSQALLPGESVRWELVEPVGVRAVDLNQSQAATIAEDGGLA